MCDDLMQLFNLYFLYSCFYIYVTVILRETVIFASQKCAMNVYMCAFAIFSFRDQQNWKKQKFYK